MTTDISIVALVVAACSFLVALFATRQDPPKHPGHGTIVGELVRIRSALQSLDSAVRESALNDKLERDRQRQERAIKP